MKDMISKASIVYQVTDCDIIVTETNCNIFVTGTSCLTIVTGTKKPPPLRFFALTHLILKLHYCALKTFPQK